MRWSGLVWVLLVLFAPQAPAQGKGEAEGAPPAGPDPDVMLSAIVHVKMKALEDAHSSANLGREREGTGIVIDRDGHVLTIGYVVMDAQTIEVTTTGQKTFPARLAGYDHATGVGLLRAPGLAGVTPIELGNAGDLALREPVLILPHGGRSNAALAYVMSRRPFAASWEYFLESALFVSPPTMQWAGAALVNREGKLVGVGSLLLRVIAPDHPVPGNVFVPVDAVKPVLADLIAHGRRRGPPRPWLGLGIEEVQGHLFVTNVTADGPAEKAGIRRGDIVVGVGTEPVRTREALYRRIWSLGPAGSGIPLRVLQGVEVREVIVQSLDRNAIVMERARKAGMLP